eukprot:9909195-Alexandrium_andersonii.AAC.1
MLFKLLMRFGRALFGQFCTHFPSQERWTRQSAPGYVELVLPGSASWWLMFVVPARCRIGKKTPSDATSIAMVLETSACYHG